MLDVLGEIVPDVGAKVRESAKDQFLPGIFSFSPEYSPFLLYRASSLGFCLRVVSI